MTRPRLLVIGNSHTAALRAAHAADPDRWQEVQVDFLAVRGAILRETEIVDGALRPRTERAQTRLHELNPDRTDQRITGHEAVAVVGLDFKPLTAVALARGAAWRALPSLAAEDDLAAMPATLMSEAAVRATLEARLWQCDAARLARALRNELDCELFVVPCPRLNHRGKWTDIPRFFGHGRAITRGDGAEIDRIWTAAARRICRRLGARFIPQPPETVTEDLLTRRKFMRADDIMIGTADGARSGPDLTHANADFGAIVLQRLIRKIAGRQTRDRAAA